MNMIQTGLPYQSKCTRTVSDSSWRKAAAPRQFNQTQHLLVSTDYSVKTSKTAAKLSAPPPGVTQNWEEGYFFLTIYSHSGKVTSKNVRQVGGLGAFRAQSEPRTCHRQTVLHHP